METVGNVMSIVQTLFAALQNERFKEFLSVFGYKSQLEDLQNTVSTIKAVFEDAERKRTLSAVEQKLIEDLKDAVYEADDLLDEFVTLAEQKQLFKDDGSISQKLRSFLSRTNPFGIAYKMSKGVKKIRKKLDAIVGNNRFNFMHNPEPIRNRRIETCSYVNENDIIGRGEDLKKITGILLDSNNQQDLSVLGIYGIGGMGKTALAQLVYNDPAVKSAFPLRLWTCVSDQDQKLLDVKEVIRKILTSTPNSHRDEGSTLEKLQSQLRQQIEGKRYLLVLDDVWTEERNQWSELIKYLVGGRRGSWIVVTTRSERTTAIMGGQRHKLEGLSELDSWQLFERVAFGSDESNPRDDDLDKIGRVIVDECARVPLAIKVLGSLLYNQDKHKWLSVKETGLAKIRKNEEAITSILQISYHHLESPLKSCFSYCAVFPKDYRMHKEMLIDLWVAQGYVVPLYDGQRVEDASEEYFSILLKRCFFQDVIVKDELGEIESCKMHDLIHDIAQSVSGKEIYAADINSENINEKVRHCSIPIFESKKLFFDKTHVRSCIYLSDQHQRVELENSFAEGLISRGRGLRALHFSRFVIKSLPNSLSTLLHLRYLNIFGSETLEVLPKSISKLYNLQFLKLNFCNHLKELPKDLSKLMKLRVLSITCCSALKYMPTGMEKLTCLHRLSDFIVGNEESFVSWKQWFDGLQGLKALNNLKGEIRVHIKVPKIDDTEICIESRCILRSKIHLNRIRIEFEYEEGDGRMDDEARIALMENLHPHLNLKELKIMNYYGTRIGWISLLPNLVKLHLFNCRQLKEWRTGVEGVGDDVSRSGMELSQLKSLEIWGSPLTWIPLCPKLEFLDMHAFNKELVFGEGDQESAPTSCPKLKKIIIDNVGWLNSLHKEIFQCLESLCIKYDWEVEKLGDVGKVFRSCSLSLRILKIEQCPNLRRVLDGGLEHLTALEELELMDCQNLKLPQAGFMPCPPFLPSLRTLSLNFLPMLENLPKWMQFLSALQTLTIARCVKLKAMPKWMPKLTSLRDLRIYFCSETLERRCQKEPQGEDWPFIQHIPTIEF